MPMPSHADHMQVGVGADHLHQPGANTGDEVAEIGESGGSALLDRSKGIIEFSGVFELAGRRRWRYGWPNDYRMSEHYSKQIQEV